MPASKRVAISGYCTLDQVIRAGVSQPSRCGGAVLYAGGSLAREGHRVTPLVRIGGDEAGTRHLVEARRAGLDTAGFALDTAADTARCTLIYRDQDLYDCVMERRDEPLTAHQLALAGQADLLVITAGGAAAGRQMLEAAPAGALVAWVAKTDEICFPADLREKLAARADVIFCTRAERPAIDAAGLCTRPGRMLFETHGARGGVAIDPAGEHGFAATPVEVSDATGAGDTFAGAVLAAILAGCRAQDAAAHGAEAARAFLLERAAHE